MIPLLALLSLNGCYKIDYVQGPSEPYATQSEWHHIGILGLVEFSDPVRLDQICPGGWAKVHNEISVLHGLVTVALGTVGLSWAYTPHTIEVYCASGQAFQVELDDQGLATSAMPIGG